MFYFLASSPAHADIPLLMDTLRSLLGITTFLLSTLPSLLLAQDSRTWTATTGHELEGTLVTYTKIDVKIRDVAGKIKSIKRAKLSPIDQNYVMDFPDLENNTKFAKGNLPKVSVRAVRSDSSETQRLGAEITLSNRHKEDLELEVLWVFYTSPPKSSKILASKPTDLLPLEPKMTRVNVKALKGLKFLTHEVRASKLSNGKAWESSMKITGFLVQVYTGGYLLDHYASNGVLKDLAEDPDLLKHFKG